MYFVIRLRGRALRKLVEIVELETFRSATEGLLTDTDVDDLKWSLALEPQQGVLIPGTGGVRKLRWAAKGKGKRTGARVIYYFHSESMPLCLITIFAKSVRVDLEAKEKKAVRDLVDVLIEQYLEK